ncbi:unnamed protein product [Notodromas monacha]|uniref:Uncharacterized protein n=1 Tax=Notodromas monacha TaxID=399045 RepID=A0A7R9BRA1_9CRUS|nr:unnamed protein product [Notodromas monacha]CAG0919351.1 unnamed protein product [Notodromas monacha]
MTPPSVTICPEPGMNLAEVQQLIESWDYLNVTSPATDFLQLAFQRNSSLLNEYLTKIGYRPQEIITGCNLASTNCVPGKNSAQARTAAGEWTIQWYKRLHLASIRACFCFRPNVSMSAGISEMFVIRLEIPYKSLSVNGKPVIFRQGKTISASDIGWFVYFHQNSAKITDLDRISYKPYHFFEPTNNQLYVQFTAQHLSFLNKDDSPCTEEPGYTYVKCVEDCVMSSEYFNCSIPLPTANYDNVKKNTCATPSELETYTRAYGGMWNNKQGRLVELEKNCGCPRRCEMIRYTAHLVQNRVNDGSSAIIGTTSNDIANISVVNRTNFVVIRGYFPSSEFESFTEQWSFDIIQLFGELGGNAGLLLGISVLSIYEGLEFLVLLFSGGLDRRTGPNAFPKVGTREPATVSADIVQELHSTL